MSFETPSGLGAAAPGAVDSVVFAWTSASCTFTGADGETEAGEVKPPKRAQRLSGRSRRRDLVLFISTDLVLAHTSTHSRRPISTRQVDD